MARIDRANRGWVRVSPHFYTSDAEIETVFAEHIEAKEEITFDAVEASGLLAQAPHLHIASYYLLEALRSGREPLTPFILAVFLLLMIGGLEGVLSRRTPLPVRAV